MSHIKKTKNFRIGIFLAVHHSEQEKEPKFWNDWAQKTLTKALSLQTLNKNQAKNLILFLGDGEPSTTLRSPDSYFN